MAPNYTLFKRYVNIVAKSTEIGTAVQFNGLDAEFNVEKSVKPEPNKCELKIYNLSAETRGKLQTLKDVKLEISAGYYGPDAMDQIAANPDTEFLIFNGDITQIVSSKEGADWVTTLRTADGVDAIQQSRLNKAFKSNTPVLSAVTDLLNGLKVDVKKVLAKLASGSIAGATKVIINSYVVQGSIYKELQKKFQEWGVDGFIQDGELVVLKPTEWLGIEPINVSASSGLVGSPEVTSDGYLRFTSLLRPEFAPGYQVLIDSLSLKGLYRIERVTYTGTTFGNEWYAEIEARPML